MSTYEVFTEQVAHLAQWGAHVAADTKDFNEIRRVDGDAVEPYLEDRLAYEAALIAAPEEVRFMLDKKAAQLRDEDLDAAEKAMRIAYECTEEADVARWAASLRAKEARWSPLDRTEQRFLAAEARAEEAEELVRSLRKEVEQLHLADMLATQRAETAERKFLQLKAAIKTYLEDENTSLHPRFWATFRESIAE